MKGTGVPFTLRKWSADHAVMAMPIAISSTAANQLRLLDNGHGKANHRSKSSDRNTNNAVKTPKISIPTGVNSDRVFLVPVAAH